MPFDQCLSLIDEVAEELGVDSIDLQRSGDVHSARITAADGHVMVVCRRADQTVTPQDGRLNGTGSGRCRSISPWLDTREIGFFRS